MKGHELIFKGKLFTPNISEFIKKLEDILKETDSSFHGEILSFEVAGFSDYEEIVNEDNIENQENVKE